VSTYSEFRFWSPMMNCEAARLSMWDKNGGEFFVHVPTDEGRRWRERRNRALDVIQQAITDGLQPGEVIVGNHAYAR
jgi:hypothetical protein